MLTEKELNNIIYVVVEVMNRTTKDILVGYFKGLTNINEKINYSFEISDDYLILENDGAIFALKLDNFNITTISIGIKVLNGWNAPSISKRSYSLKTKGSIKLLQEVQEYYININKANENGLVNMSDFKLDKNSYLAMAMKRYNRLDCNVNHENVKQEKSNNTTKTYITSKTAEVKTSILKRTTKYNKDEAIKKMAAKIKKLKVDKYVVVLPTEKTVNNNTKKEEGKATKQADLSTLYGEDFRADYFYC